MTDQTLSQQAQQMIDEMRPKAKVAADAAAVSRPVYTPDNMVQLMIEQPTYTHRQFADHFGYPASWFSGVMASPAFQLALDKRRNEVINPMLTGTLDDMFRALLIRSVAVLQEKLSDPETDPELVVKAAALGVKALGMGMSSGEEEKPKHSINAVADRIAAAMAGRTPSAVPQALPRDYTIDACLTEVKSAE